MASGSTSSHLLLTYPWPGNVRELDNLLQRALILVNGPVIRPEHIQFELANDVVVASNTIAAINLPGQAGNVAKSSAPGVNGPAADDGSAGSLASSLNQAERDLILEALRSGQGNRRDAAQRLGISARTLRYKLARLREAGIDVPAA